VHRGDAPAEYQAHRLSAQLLDVDLQASKGQQLIHAHHITAVRPTIGAAAMDEFGTTAGAVGDAVPDQLRALFNNPDDVRVQQLPCVLPGLDSLAVHFGAGARTVPHQHNNGQHLVFVEGVGVVADEDGVHVVRTGDVVSNPPNAWHWHGATPGAAATHVTFEAPGDFDLAVERRDWDDSYGPNLGT
jgi:mannose-6-phosphate isomerase-like protein (cupin superfamily)